MKETVLQFGAGNFLRGFVDAFIDEANRASGDAFGGVVVVQSTGTERARALNASGGRYHIAVQGFQGGKVVDRVEEITSIRRALHAGTEWDEVLRVAASPDLRWIVSNTTEAGFVLEEQDREFPAGAPLSFPAKLLAVLLARRQAGLPGLDILPCELIERNGDRLRALVLEQAARWNTGRPVLDWLENGCRWINNLVDRIVPGPPPKHGLLESDPLLISVEPFAFWAIESGNGFALEHPAVKVSPDITPYYLRKVRLLNGAHTALVCHALPRGLETVRECVEDPEVGPWLEKLLFDEIVPVLEERVADAPGFAREVLERFRNPFLEHKLASIALNHEAKLKVRLQPTLEEFRRKFGREPERLAALLAGPVA